MKKFKIVAGVLAIIMAVTIFAACGANSYKVTFNVGSGVTNAPQEQMVEKGGYATVPATVPTKADYIFAGWFENKEYTKEFDFNKPITKKTTIYAKWDPNSTYTFEDAYYANYYGLNNQNQNQRTYGESINPMRKRWSNRYSRYGLGRNFTGNNNSLYNTGSMGNTTTGDNALSFAGSNAGVNTLTNNRADYGSAMPNNNTYNASNTLNNPYRTGRVMGNTYGTTVPNTRIANLPSISNMPTTTTMPQNQVASMPRRFTNSGAMATTSDATNSLNNVYTGSRAASNAQSINNNPSILNNNTQNSTTNTSLLNSTRNNRNYFVNYVNGANSTREMVSAGGTVANFNASPVSAEGKTFGGWYLDTNYTIPFDQSTPVNNNMNVYAKWNV